jgi:hypothetical protein
VDLAVHKMERQLHRKKENSGTTKTVEHERSDRIHGTETQEDVA